MTRERIRQAVLIVVGLLFLAAAIPLVMFFSKDLNAERLKAESDDLAWSVWYDHYHSIVVRPDDKDIFLQVHTGLRFSLETAALYLLLSAIFVPPVRHWWYIAPASVWVVLLVVESIEAARKALDKWSTLNEQVKYLSSV